MTNRPKSNRYHSAPISKIEPFERRLLMSTYTVNTLSDAVTSAASTLTLRQAVADANAHAGDDTISFSPAVFTAGKLHTIVLTQGQITFTDRTGATTVTGPGATTVAVSGNAASRIFDVATGATVSISGLAITDGKSSVADANGNTYGGAIVNQGTLTLSNSTVSGSAVLASGYQTQYLNNFGHVPGAGLGGAIFSTGSLTINGSTLAGNSVINATQFDDGGIYSDNARAALGGAIYSTGTLSVTSSVISGNTAKGDAGTTSETDYGGAAFGGGIDSTSTTTIVSSQITGNSAIGANSAVYGSGGGGDAGGGGVWAGAGLTITNSQVNGNYAGAGNSGVASGRSGAALGGGVYAGASLGISGTTVQGNEALGGFFDVGNVSGGGGIYAVGTADISNDSIVGNAVRGGPTNGGAGGGIDALAVLTIQTSTISGNSVISELSEGTSELHNGGLSVGGGVAAAGTTSISDSTVSGNAVKGGYGYSTLNSYLPTVGGDGDGGGLFASAALTITNSTVANNSATGGAGGSDVNDEAGPAVKGGNGNGGGVFSSSLLQIFDSTVSGNKTTAGVGGSGSSSSYDGAAGVASGGGVDAVTPLLDNSIIADNTAASVFNDVAGSANSSSSHNFVGVGGGLTNGHNGNIIGSDAPRLSALGFYGGPTQTFVPMPGSPVIDAGSNSLIPAGDTTDQRGFPRIQGKLVDIGSTEFGVAAITGLVFNDQFATGKQDHSIDVGLAGWTVYLDLNHDGTFDAGDLSAVTGSDGYYNFNGIPAATYSLGIVGQKNFRLTTPGTITVAAKANTTTGVVSFGETGDALLSGTVIDSVKKTGLAGWRVYIDLNNSGKYVTTDPSVITASDGSWSLSTPLIGTYTVRIVPEAGYSLASPATVDFVLTIGKGSERIGNVFSESKIT